MEIEGIINHSLAGLEIKKSMIKKNLAICKIEIDKWSAVKRIHANEQLKNALKYINHVRQLMSKKEYMSHFISNTPDESLFFMGFHLDDIQFYIELRNHLEPKNDLP